LALLAILAVQKIDFAVLLAGTAHGLFRPDFWNIGAHVKAQGLQSLGFPCDVGVASTSSQTEVARPMGFAYYSDSE